MDEARKYLLDHPEKKVKVFVLPKLSNELSILNYPTKNKDLIKSIPCSSAKYKAQQKTLQLRYDIDLENRHFDSARAQEIGESSEIFRSEVESDDQPTMDSMFVKSSPVETNSKYTVCHFKDGCLYLILVDNMFNMTPDFSYLVTASAEKPEKKDDDDKMQLVTKKFVKPDSEKAKKEKERKSAEEQRKNEPWWDLKCLDEVEQSKGLLDRLTERGDGDKPALCPSTLTPEEYQVSFLKPISLSRETAGITSEDENLRNLALSELKQMKLEDMIKAYMLNVNVASFNSLIYTLTINAAKQLKEALHVLQDCAVLVQGNWVIKSKILYPENTLCGVSGLPAATLAKARDFVLLLFAHKHEVKRTFVANETRLPSEEVTGILKQFSKLDRRTGNWEFILPTDEEFIKRHHEDVKRQNFNWNQERLKYEKEKYKVPGKPLPTPERKRNSSTRGHSESQ